MAPQKRQYCRTTVLNIISSLCSVASIAFCILLSINTTDIKNRVVDLESGNGEHTFIRAPGYSMDDFNSLIQQRVNELLSQVRLDLTLALLELIVCRDSITDELTLFQLCRNPPQILTFYATHHVQMNENSILFTFQRSYENLVKIRTARQASPECSCPPGK